MTCWLKPLASVSFCVRIFTRTMASKAGNKSLSETGEIPFDALDYDSYKDKDEEGPYKTREQQLERLKQLDNQGYSQSLEEVYPNIEMKTPEKLEEEIKQFEQFKNEEEYKEYCESEDRLQHTKKQQEENKDAPDQ